MDRPELAALWSAVHDRLSSGGPVSRIRLAGLSLAERAALADLLGAASLPSMDPVIGLDRLDRAVREATGCDCAALVTELIGPTGDRRRAAASAVVQRDELWRWLERHDVIAAEPALRDWVDGCRRAGLIDGSVQSTRRLLSDAVTVLGALPAAGQPLPSFAVAVLGDTHALDPDGRLSGIVLHALSCLYGRPRRNDALGRRQLWEQAGIAGDALSATVLVSGLRASGNGLVADLCTACADAGQAASITLAMLRSSPGLRLETADVWVVENPSIMTQALSRFGARCPPLVCLSGWPNGAGMLLLELLADAGARLRYHGDFDGDGIRIAAHVMARVEAVRPWRFNTADYLAVARGLSDGPGVGRMTQAPWDAALAPAMTERGLAVFEEQVTDQLLTDLADAH